MNLLKLEFGRAVFSRGFLAGCTGFVCCALLGIWRPVLEAFTTDNLYEAPYYLDCLTEAISSRYLLLALPVLAALPYAGSFVEDVKSRFLRSYLPRCSRQLYLACRTGAVAFSGAAVMAAGALASAGILALVLLPHEFKADILTAEAVGAMQNEMCLQILLRVFLLALSGSLWALIGAAAAAASMNRHLAFAAPFLFYYFLIILSTRYFPGLEGLNPQLWAAASGIWETVPQAAMLLTGELILAAALAVMLLMERRLKDV